MTIEDPLLTVKDVSRLLSVSLPTVWRLIAAGEISSILIGKRARRIRRDDLMAYIESRRQIGGEA
ncbi:helix-turn-helix domain-containing protein [Chloroflexota bacterium]